MEKGFEIPVLFLVYNRPEVSRQVLAKIADMKPKRLFVAADGPNANKPQDAQKCAATRNLIVEGINWDCEVQYLFREANMGCKKAVSEGISWFFSQVEQGIILEDDCLPTTSFFYYCQEMLHRYQDDTRVFTVNGCNFGYQPEPQQGQYGFTKFMNMWGWASWRRSAQLVDYQMKEWQEMSELGKLTFLRKKLHNYAPVKFDWGWVKYWKEKFDALSRGEINTWDYQWVYAGLKHDMFSVFPMVNQVENIGFDTEGTHTIYTSKVEFPEARELGKIQPASQNSLLVDQKFEEEYVKKVWAFHHYRPLSFHLKNLLLKALGKY